MASANAAPIAAAGRPLAVGKDGAQNQIFKGLSLEAAQYVASLTGSIIHFETEAH